MYVESPTQSIYIFKPEEVTAECLSALYLPRNGEMTCDRVTNV